MAPYALLAGLAGQLAMAIGVLVMLGWWLELPLLRSVAPGLATMKINTALGFALSGAAIWLQRHPGTGLRERRAATILGALVATLALITIIEYVLKLDFGVDQLLARDLATDPAIAPPGRMSIATAGYFVLLGLALVLLDAGGRRWPRPAPGLASLAAFGGFVGTLGYLFGAQAMYRFGPYSSLAVHTGALFIVTGCGVLLARPEQGFTRHLTSPLIGGSMARRLLPSLVLLIIGFAWLRLLAQQAGYFGTEFGLALMATFSATCLFIGTSLAARHLNNAHAQLEDQQRIGAHFTAIVESAQVAIVGKTVDGIVTSWNPGAERIFGYTEQEMLGLPMVQIFPEDRLHEEDEILAQIRRGALVGHFRTRRRCKDGRIIDVLVTVSPIRDPSGRIIGASKIARDITEMVAMQDDLARSNKDLEQFAYIASHDLREPLRGVAGCLQILERRYKEKLDEKGSELIRHSVDGANRMQSLIDDLLAYSQVGSRGGNFQSIESQAALDAALQNLSTSLGESRGEVSRGALPRVRADLMQLTQLFQNLVGNALKFRSADPPRIHVGAEPDAGSWRFHVRDNGIGLDPKFADRIFEVFQRLHTRTEYPGTGIGLAMCRKIVQRHGGRIWVESAPGNGATFYFTLPAAS